MSKSVLIVDDEPTTRHMLRMLFELEGFVTYEAQDGREALEQVDQNHPDVVILDVMMPEMDGITACKIIRSNPATQTLPIIMLSGKAHYEAVEEGLQAGANLYMGKPMQMPELMKSIHELLPLETAVVYT